MSDHTGSRTVGGRVSTSGAQSWAVSTPLPDATEHAVSASQAIQSIKHRIKDCSRNIDVYCFNVHPDELEAAQNLLDKMDGRKPMRLTYNDKYNFVVKYMPHAAHQIAVTTWNFALNSSLSAIIGSTTLYAYGLAFFGGTTFQLGFGKKKEANSSICRLGSNSPSVILEVGDSECLSQLRIDAKNWLESTVLDVQLVVILSIDRPPPTQLSNLPRITIEHWKASPVTQPPCSGSQYTRQRDARMVWQADWTNVVSPTYYILLEDLFHPSAIPPNFGGATRAVFDPVDVANLRRVIHYSG